MSTATSRSCQSLLALFAVLAATASPSGVAAQEAGEGDSRGVPVSADGATKARAFRAMLVDRGLSNGGPERAFSYLETFDDAEAADWIRLAAKLEERGETRWAAKAYQRAGRTPEAVRLILLILDDLDARLGPGHASAVTWLDRLARLAPERAVPRLREALRSEKLGEGFGWKKDDLELALATALTDLDRRDEAIGVMQQLMARTGSAQPGHGPWAARLGIASLHAPTDEQLRIGPYPELRLLGRLLPENCRTILERRLAQEEHDEGIRFELGLLLMNNGREEEGLERILEIESHRTVELSVLPRKHWLRCSTRHLETRNLLDLERLAGFAVESEHWPLAEAAYDVLFGMTEDGGLNGFPFALPRPLLEARPEYLLGKLERIRATDSKNVHVWRDTGDLYWRLGKNSEAESSWKRAVSLDAEDVLTRARLDSQRAGAPPVF